MEHDIKNDKKIGIGKQIFFYVSVVFLIIIALSRGIINFDVIETFSVIFNINEEVVNPIHVDIIEYLRAPRFILALLAGSSLAVLGTVMQALLNNPLADPYFLGISSGAALGAVIAIVMHMGSIWFFDGVAIAAFLGAVITAMSVLFVSYVIGRGKSFVVLIIGLGVNSLYGAFITLILALTADSKALASITYWLLGSLTKANWEANFYIALTSIPIMLFFVARSRILNLMLLGDEVSLTLGHELAKSRKWYLLLTSVAIAFIVYNIGIVGFVGLAVPHMARLLVGNNHRILLPVVAVLGALFLAWCDVLSKLIIDNGELPIGIVVGLMGSPVFIHLLLKYRRT